ncbi:hypothetical protein BKL51_01395 [Rodentibacter sp. Ppn85]|nr:hypothetical protein BKL51_01395 [Rodentibacter sp. Ppn85]
MNNNNGTLEVKLSRDLNLTSAGSITLGDTLLNSTGLTITGGPSVTKGGVNAGNKTITNVANGTNGTDAVNLNQLNASVANAGFNLVTKAVTGTNGQSSEVDGLTAAGKRLATNENFTLDAGNNIVIKQIDNGYEIATSNNLVIGEKGANGKDGVDGSIGVNGKDGSAVAINGKDGSISLTGPKGADGKDGASANISVKDGAKGLDGNDGKNGESKTRIVYKKPNGDIEEVATLKDGLKFKGDDGKEIAKKLNETLSITGGAKGTLTDNNIGVVNEGGSLKVKLAENITLGNNGSVNIGNTTVNNDGLTIKGGPSVTAGGINAGNKKITGVANGTNPTDAVNLSQLNASAASSKTEVKAGNNVNIKKETGANGQDIYTVNANTSTVSNGSSKIKVTSIDKGNNVTDYAVDLSDEAKAQLAKEESVTAGDTNVKVTPNGTNASGGKDFAVSLNKDLNLTKDGSITLGNTTLKEGNLTMGNTTVNNDGVTIKDGPSITNNGVNAGDKKISNVKDGDITPTSKDAINGGQLYTAMNNTGFNLATNGQDTATDKRINNNEVFNLNQGNNIVVKQIDNGYEISTGNNLVIGEKGKPGQNGQPGKDGVDGSIGVNGKDGSSVVINGKDGSIGLTGPKGADGKDGVSANLSVKDGAKGLDGNDGKNGESKTRIVYKKPNGDVEEVATLNDGLKFKGDNGEVINKKLNETLNITGGAKGTLTDNNIGVVNEGGSLKVKLAENITLGNNGSVNIGNTTVNNDGLTIKGGPSVTAGGINAGNKVISNVANGVKGTDAVNMNQLNQVRGDIYNVNNRVDKLDKRVRGIGANAAAASSLPQVMSPGKSMVAAAAGGYSGASAVAVGYSRASDNGKVILKLTGTANSAGHYSGGVGVGYQW